MSTRVTLFSFSFWSFLLYCQLPPPFQNCQLNSIQYPSLVLSDCLSWCSGEREREDALICVSATPPLLVCRYLHMGGVERFEMGAEFCRQFPFSLFLEWL